MIRFKQKIYTTREVLLRKDWFLPDPEIEERFGKCEIVLLEDKNFLSQVPILSSDKTRVKKLKKSLLEGYLYEDKEPGEETHYLKRFSIPGRSHVYSKKINPSDRLNYRIFPPEINNGKYIQRVTLINRVGHGISKTVTYSS